MTTWNILRKFFSPILVHPWDYFWNIIEALLISSYAIISLEITRRIIIAIQAEDSEKLQTLLIFFVLLSVALTLGRFLLYKKGWSPIMHNGIAYSLKEYMKKFVYAEGSAIEKIGSGKFLTTLDKGLHDWYDLLFQLTYHGVINISFILYALVSIFWISPLAGWISLGLFLLAGIVGILANIWMREKRNLRRDAYKEALHNMTIMIMSRGEILQNDHLFDTFIDKISHHLNRAKNYHHRVVIGFLVMEEFPRLMVLVIRIGLYIFIANMLWNGGGSFADFAIFITTIAITEKALNEFLNLMRDAMRLFSFVDLLWKTFDTLPAIAGYAEGKKFLPEKHKDIILKNIGFSYDSTLIFSDFSVTISGGKKTALVGASGGGKTTLMKLIAGYLHADTGEISIMGNVLGDTALKSYYPHIGYLTQDPSVFDGTIRDNLISVVGDLGDTKTDTDARFMEALKNAECDFVFELEKGLDTEIGEKGIRLSGGQKQRIAIAKIFLKNPEIILLDEPTSALDSFSEEKITQAMHRLFEGRTVIVIAHRLQTVKEADEIIVIEEGKIVERGNHESLTKKDGVYTKMLKLQSGF